MEEVVKGQKSSDQTPKTELLNRNEVAKLLQISLPTLNAWSKAGRIPSYRIGSRIRYKKNEVLDSLNVVGKYKKGGQSEK